MKQGALKVAGLAAASLLLTGCATPIPYGVIFTEVKFPVAVGDTTVPVTKTGTAKSQSVLGLIATGDSSITTAMQQGNIKRINRVDYSTRNILGFLGEYTTTVYGD